MDPYPAARLASYLSGRVPKLSLQLPANFMGPGEHDEAARCGHDLGCLGRRPSSKPHGESWPGTLGQSSRHLRTITISAVSAQPSLVWSPAIDGEPEACGDARVEGAWYGFSYHGIV